MRILKSIWFTPMGESPIGIVLGKGKVMGEYRAYIGTGIGESESIDTEHIAKRGAKFPVEAAKLLFGIK